MPEPGSVLLIGNFLSRSGAARQVCEELALRLEDSGWRVHTSSPVRNKLLRMADMMRTAWTRRNEYDIAQIDVFSGSAFRWAEAAAWTLRRAHRPYILTLHGGNLPEFAKTNPDRVRRLLASAAAVTAPSGYLVEAMRPFREVIALPNGIDFEAYPYRHRASVTPKLVWVRSFHKLYNPSMAVGVVARLAAEFPSIRLTMVGPDKGDGSFQAVQNEARQAGVADRIEFIPGVPKSEVPATISRGDIFLNTTDFDNTPVTVLEAMACGACVVTTDAGGIPYLVQNEANGLVVPKGDAAAMAAAVRRLLIDPELAAHLSAGARAKAAQADWTTVLAAWQRLLRAHVDPQIRPAGEALRSHS
ncbi:MAG: glycosyltransferase family 4 protein [Bryobacteraceae bacterium]